MIKHETIILRTTIKAGIPKSLALLIVAQAKHETNNFTSKVFQENNNAFGYKYIKGATLQLEHGRMSPEGNAYAHYKNLKNSTKEIIAWIYRRVKEKKFPNLDTIKTPQQYAIYLKITGYYTDTIHNYTMGLKKFLK